VVDRPRAELRSLKLKLLLLLDQKTGHEKQSLRKHIYALNRRLKRTLEKPTNLR
jgi:hypothetical protein